MVLHGTSKLTKTILFAGILLGGYIVLLVGLVYVGQQHLRQSLLDQAELALSKQAAAVGYFLTERRDEIDELTRNPALDNLIANRALGMSMEYGLRASLLSVLDELERLHEHKKLLQHPVYSRISFFDKSGELLASAGNSATASSQLELKAPEAAQPASLHVYKANDSYTLYLLATVNYRDRVAGLILAEINLREVLTPLLKQSALGGISNHLLLLGPADEPLLTTHNSDGDFTHAGQDEMLEMPVADSGFSLKGAVSLSYGLALLTSPWLLLALALITIPVLGGGYQLLRLNRHHLMLQARYLSSRKQQLALHRFRAQLDLSADLIVVIDPVTSGFLDVNQAMCDFFGRQRSELLNMRFIELSGRYRTLSQWRQFLGAIRAQGRITSEDSGLHADGRPFHLEINAHYSNEGGQESIFAIFRDISERKAVERTLQQASQRVTSVLDGIDAAVYVADMETYELLYINPRVRDEFGDVVGRKCWQALQTGQPGPCSFCTNERLLDSRGQPAETTVWEFQNTRTGTWYHCADRAIPWDDGRYVRLEVATDITARIQDESALRAAHQQLESLAYCDPLTKLANRRLFSNLLQQAFARADRSHTILAVCYLDLDGFKEINDSVGHHQGDQLLIQVSDRLQATLRGEDTVARWGGDEFALLISDQYSEEECANTLDRLLDKISLPYPIDGRPFNITASIGVTVYPQDQGDPDTLLRHADQAMYIAKQQGRNRYHFFDPDQDRRVHAHREIVHRVVAAIEHDELILHYQPKVDMALGHVFGFEALVRWHHPQQGLIPQTEFLPHIEGQETQIELDWWVLKQAIRQVSAWHAQGLELTVSINVSPGTLQKPGFADRLQLTLDQAGVEGGLIELEILESGTIEDIDTVARVISACSEYGVTFALDDYGTGYSSLTFIRRLPVKTLKVDQAFVRDMLKDHDDLNIVEGVIGLAKAFERDVIAEGVESREIGVRLLELGCYQAQGYGISKPMPPEAVSRWLAEFSFPEEWLATARRLSLTGATA